MSFTQAGYATKHPADVILQSVCGQKSDKRINLNLLLRMHGEGGAQQANRKGEMTQHNIHPHGSGAGHITLEDLQHGQGEQAHQEEKQHPLLAFREGAVDGGETASNAVRAFQRTVFLWGDG